MNTDSFEKWLNKNKSKKIRECYECYACGSNHSTHGRTGNTDYERWYLNHDIDDNALCAACFAHLIHRSKFRLEQIERIKKRQCYACGSTTTLMAKSSLNGKYYPKWHLNHDKDDNVLCDSCRDTILITPRRLMYTPTSKSMMLKTVLSRKRICSKCGYVGRTVLHHTVYDDSQPMNNTVELCRSCHASEHWELKHRTIH